MNAEQKQVEAIRADWDACKGSTALYNVGLLLALLAASEAQVKALETALRSLNRELPGLPPCFCEMATNNPMVRQHSKSCVAAHASLKPKGSE